MGKFSDVDYSTIGIEDKNEPSKKLAKIIKEVKERDYQVGDPVSVLRNFLIHLHHDNLMKLHTQGLFQLMVIMLQLSVSKIEL